jgi:lipoprotein signal peptidase
MGGVVTFTLVDNGGIEFSVFGTTKLLAPVIRLFCITG